ncbi:MULTISPECIES: hypothetical protein [Franconibacter]|uniref:Uncharacterized protein n=1 Tax=Franconibacter daqui TaxID=2047724 RepID=A0ABV1PHY4_9ENTR|nr:MULTISPECIES: hypothetical protein [Franconibacter]EGT4305889.1 hypothetical protein [Cronobacter sakazakii]EGT4326185.1 hypothetical protein [Cronobacter sakazakii]EGT4363825.1 hypothetical protein [Cronobacter sakazakii]MCK1969189.1 hypothetical protein [Franconibacter sp. IITDAS19]GGD13490.1 hypothetical protein GCM10011513_08670 [Franconibacter daqui]
MTEDNVVSFLKVKQQQIDSNLDQLEVVKKFTEKHVKPKSLVGIVKKQLKLRGISYRVSFPSCDLTGFDKKAVVIFPEERLIFAFVSKPMTGKGVEGWTVEQCICSEKHQPIDYTGFIINKISEAKHNGQKTAKTQPVS